MGWSVFRKLRGVEVDHSARGMIPSHERWHHAEQIFFQCGKTAACDCPGASNGLELIELSAGEIRECFKMSAVHPA
jgi:hypothetical protein